MLFRSSDSLAFCLQLVNKFWDSEPIVARFSSNKVGNLDIRIARNFAELHLALCMHVVCR